MSDYRNETLHLMLGDCLTRLKEIPDNSVKAVITSPPYAKQRDYNGYSDADYAAFMLPIIQEIKRVLTPDGSFMMNIKEHCDKGQRSLYVYKMVIDIVEKIGLRFVDEFIWNKTNPFPTGSKKRFKDGFERCYHFSKSKDYTFNPEAVLVKSESKWLDGEKRRKNKGEHNCKNGSGMNMAKRVASDMVRPSNVITGSSSNLNIGHPAVFPLYLPEFFVKVLSNEGDTVLDPFMGSGSTGIAAVTHNRKFIGIELDEKYFELAKERVLTA